MDQRLGKALPAVPITFGNVLLEDVLDFFHAAVEEHQTVRGLSGLSLIEDEGGQGRLIGHDVIVEVGSDS